MRTKTTFVAFIIITSVVLLPATTAVADGFTVGVGTYHDWSELVVSVAYDSSSYSVKSCTVQPDCNKGEPLPSAVLSPGEAAGTSNFFGFSPWSGFAPCTAIMSADLFVCPFDMGVASPPLTPIYAGSTGGPDVQNP